MVGTSPKEKEQIPLVSPPANQVTKPGLPRSLGYADPQARGLGLAGLGLDLGLCQSWACPVVAIGRSILMGRTEFFALPM